MRKVYFIILLFMPAIDNFGQVASRDSLLLLLPGQKEDTNKVNLLYTIGDAFENSSPDTAKLYIREGGDLSTIIGYTKGVQKFYRHIAYIYAVQSKYDSVLYYNRLGLELAKSESDTFSIGVSLFNIGIAYRFMSDYENAVIYNLEGAKLLEGKGYTSIEAGLYDGLQVLYMTLGQYDQAIFYGEKAVSFGRLRKDQNPLAVALNNLSLSYMEVDRLDDAQKVLGEALTVSRYIENKSVEGSVLNNLAEIAIRKGKMELLNGYAERSLQIHREINSLEGIAVSTRCMAIYYLHQKDFAKASEYCLAALKIDDENGFLLEKSQCLKTLSSIAFASQDFNAGYGYLVRSQKIDGEIFNSSLAEKESTLQIKYETEKKEIKINELEAEKKVNQLTMQKRTLMNYFLIGAALTILITFLLSFRNYKQKQKLQQQRINELETEKQLLATEAVLKGEEQERTRLAKDLHDGLGGMLSGLKYSFTTMKKNLIMTPENQQAFARSIDMLDSSIKEMRRVAHNMMPESLLKFGLGAAIQDFCNDINDSGALKVNFVSLGLEKVLLEQTTAITIYRIVQELINNILKHAAAKTAIVQVSNSDGHFTVTVEDDGKGFDTATLKTTKGIGWTNIENRVAFLKGTLDITSKPGSGSSIQFEFNI